MLSEGTIIGLQTVKYRDDDVETMSEEVTITVTDARRPCWVLMSQIWVSERLPWKASKPYMRYGMRGFGAQESLELLEEYLERPITIVLERADRLAPDDHERLKAHRGKITFTLHDEAPIAGPGPWPQRRRSSPRGAT